MHVDHTHNIIELKHVSFAYPEQKEVLSDINFNLHRGDYLGIIGPNGGGKTTLLKLMLGLLKPSQGEVLVFGQPLTKFKDWPKIGYVPQKAVQFEANFPITVKDVVSMGRYGRRGLFNRLNKSDWQQTEQALKHVEMWEHRDTLLSDLSGGQQQRVFIARALASQPEVILLDEPTVGVDVAIQQQFYALLRKLNHELDITLVLVSHDIDVVTRETTELACINKTVVYDDQPKKFLHSQALKQMYGDTFNIIMHTH